ncbi:MAG: hypothetical protein JXR27_05425 [Paludibacteraceae bacterium]|nr:hypothetical protein [Paludibacteraceae bacterium]
MLAAFIISAILLIFGVLILGFRIFFTRHGEFPNIHIGGSQALKSKGVACATTQDREARRAPKRYTNADMIKEITGKL